MLVMMLATCHSHGAAVVAVAPQDYSRLQSKCHLCYE